MGIIGALAPSLGALAVRCTERTAKGRPWTQVLLSTEHPDLGIPNANGKLVILYSSQWNKRLKKTASAVFT